MLGFNSTASRATRAKAFGFAASIAMAAYVSAPSAALAQDLIPAAVKASLPPACLKLQGAVAQLDCGTAYNKKMEQAANARTAASEARIATANVRIADADKENACLGLIMKDLESNGSKTANLTEPPKRGEACRVAKDLKLVAGS